MQSRQELILETIIKEHIATATPVSSGALVKKYGLEISPATVRNEMAVLERDDYIVQPHTSAGRIPTERAYVWYLDRIEGQENPTDGEEIDKFFEMGNEQSYKDLSKQLAQLTGNAVFWAFHKHNLYYTGISNLFQQPEFSRINVIHDISGVIDRLDEIINGIFDETQNGVHVQLGSNNPFGSIFGTVFVKYKHDGRDGMFGILGPMRMDYHRILSLSEKLKQKFT